MDTFDERPVATLAADEEFVKTNHTRPADSNANDPI
jgi:hypothetical protein